MSIVSRLVTALGNLPRVWKLALLISFDAVALCFALWAAYSLRYGSWLPPNSFEQFGFIATAAIVAIPIFVRMGLYRAVIRYLPEHALWRIVQATTLAAICWVAVMFISEIAGRGAIPRSVPILYWAIATTLIASSRFIVKRLLWKPGGDNHTRDNILIYGAGIAGAELANALRREKKYRIVAFLDDNEDLQGRDVAGVRVYPPSSLARLASLHGVDEVILSIPSLKAARRQQIVSAGAGLGVKFRTVPQASELVGGKYQISNVREIGIDELLGRSSVPPDPALLREMIDGKTIMVTGAGGSIGSELCRQIVDLAPQRLVLFEANEFALYQIHRELAIVHDRSIVTILGSIVDADSVRSAIAQHGVEVIFHAAAHKHVPLVEANPIEGIRNNVMGTKVLVDAAFELGVRHFVLISSDKAVRPTNVMGATKRWAELLVQQKAKEAEEKATGQRFCAVRFGNVLGSAGSVVPLFKEQIAKGGPVTITDMAMTRYFMSIREAAELIIQAGAMSRGGDVFLLDMGSPVVIKDLAETMIKLAGLTVRNDANPNGDIQLVVTGKRPGEKLYEELFYDAATASSTRHPKIMRATGDIEGRRPLDEALAQLAQTTAERNEQSARKVLFDQIREIGG